MMTVASVGGFSASRCHNTAVPVAVGTSEVDHTLRCTLLDASWTRHLKLVREVKYESLRLIIGVQHEPGIDKGQVQLQRARDSALATTS